ncbi:hypothetical protein A9Q84_09270 [Halobacteriovorax marinus]|uniref:Uncharacterized protein n=1 Tax=Halobacteriovorax marinus TaxID=97084 RepID=A0A1Y5FC39_9BACT|nr:hypothetical protein A9Q84_09270 [Halobacteriovorax marinus]
MIILSQIVLFKISLLALFGSWKVLQESNCQSQLHHRRVRAISRSLITNKEQYFYQCQKLTTIKVLKSSILINNKIEIEK